MAVVAPMPRAKVKIAAAVKPGRSGKLAQGVASVLQQILDQRQPPFGVIIFPHCLHRAELQHGLTARLRGRQAGTQILFRLPGEMFGYLFLEALVDALSGGEVRETYEEAPQNFHARSSALTSKKRAMMAAV